MNQFAWLALASVIIGGLCQALKSGRLEAWLIEKELPTIPKKAVPWVAVGLGAAGGFVTAMSQGDDWQTALSKTLAGVFAGALPVAGHEMFARKDA